MSQPTNDDDDDGEVDPFDCFGYDDDDGDDDTNHHHHPQSSKNHSESAQQNRDPSCGFLQFHRGTEQSLCHYVEQAMATASLPPLNNAATTTTQTHHAQQVLQHVDRFCYSRHWMMHVGSEKGKVIRDYLKDFCGKVESRLRTSSEDPVVVVELGTYCGYSSILIAKTILDFVRDCTGIPKPNFHIFSVDIDPNHQAVAHKLIQMAKLDDFITLILLPMESTSNTLLSDIINKTIQSTTTNTSDVTNNNDKVPLSKIDFLFIDHDKDSYCCDLQQLEQVGMIKSGTHVAADNVVFFDIPYRAYMRQLQSRGIVSTRLVLGQMEYIIPTEHANSNDTMQDGIELTVYLKDPRS